MSGGMTCPFWDARPLQYPGMPTAAEQEEYHEALKKINWDNVKKDIKEVFHDSKEWWPADHGH